MSGWPQRRASEARGRPTTPLVAVLCAPERARACAAAVALAVAATVGRGVALAAAVACAEGVFAAGAPGTPAARRAAARVRAQGTPAAATGRIGWVAAAGHAEAPAPERREQRSACTDAADTDAAARAAGAATVLARAAAAARAPAALALPFARTPALDRVLAWHDAVVVVRAPDVGDVLFAHVLRSVADLGRPVAAMAAPPRLASLLAEAGLRTPPEASAAVADLGLDGGAVRPRRHG